MNWAEVRKQVSHYPKQSAEITVWNGVQINIFYAVKTGGGAQMQQIREPLWMQLWVDFETKK